MSNVNTKVLSLFLNASVKPAAVTDPSSFLSQWDAPLRTLGFNHAPDDSSSPSDKLTSIRTQVIEILRAETQAAKAQAASAPAASDKPKGERKPKGLDPEKPIVRILNAAGEVTLEVNSPSINDAEKLAARRLMETEVGSVAILTFNVCGQEQSAELTRDDAFAMVLTDTRPATAFKKVGSKGDLKRPWMRAPATTKARFSQG